MLGQDWKTLLYSDCTLILFSDSALYRISDNRQTNKSLSILTWHPVSLSGHYPVFPGPADVLRMSCPGVYRVLTQQETIHSVVKSVTESLKQALARWTVIRDCFHSRPVSLEVLKTSVLCVWRRDMKVWFGFLGVGSNCVYVCMKYLMMSMKIRCLRYVLCVWDIKVWEVSVSDCGFDKAYGFLSVHICRL